MSQLYPFEPVLLRNRLGQGMTLQVCSFMLASDHACVLVKASEGSHFSILAKNAENIIFQLRERFSRQVKNFSMIESRESLQSSEEQWYGWNFDWLGNLPIDGTSYTLSAQQKNYYQNKILGLEFNKASGGN